MKIKDSKWVKYVLGGVGAIVAGGAIMLGGVMIGYPAISSMVGLAVAQSSTLWNNVIDAAKGDSQGSGILGMSPYLYNGASFDRVRGDTTNGMDVDVTRISGSVTPADAYANPTTANQMWSLNGVFNGTTWDRQDSVSNTNNIATTSQGTIYSTSLSTWSVTNTPAAGSAATASKATGGGTVRHVATSITICFQDSAINTVGRVAHLRDGATGAGTILRSWYLSNGGVAGGAQCENLSGLNMTGSANTAMTLEFAAAASGTSLESVTLTGYSTP